MDLQTFNKFENFIDSICKGNFSSVDTNRLTEIRGESPLPLNILLFVCNGFMLNNNMNINNRA